LSFINRYITTLALVFLFQVSEVNGDVTPLKVFFIEPELMLGKNIEIYEDFPHSNLRSNYVLNLSVLNQDTSKHWVKFYKFPTLGLSFSYSNLGNQEIFKNEFSLIPFIILKTSRDQRKSFDFKIGLGVSYFNHPFHNEKNPDNKVIGSNFTWAFKLFMYKKFLVTKKVNLKFGFGFLHSSNAHTTIPNYGMNSAMISLAAQFATKPYDPDFAMKLEDIPVNKRKYYFIQTRFGYGWHELGGTFDPIGTRDFPVNSYSLSGGAIIKQHIKLSLGLTYRFYNSFYDYLVRRKNEIRTELGENPRTESSNVFVFIGTEFLIGHIGLDFAFGFNLHKPFYEEFNVRWEFNEGFKKFRNKYLVTRFGLKFYLISNERMPRHNIYLGSHINANFGKADFMDLSFGYVFLIKN
jgi:hypothetical protein